jgi:Zn finger protein HypA/HybF involved in hydrogenase expression
MHEAGVANRILEAVLARAEAAGARRVTVVEIEAGEACGVAGESLELHFGEHARGTIAEGASLVVRRAGDPAAFRLVAIDVEDEPADD